MSLKNLNAMSQFCLQKLVVAFNESFKGIVQIKKAVNDILGISEKLLNGAPDYVEEGKVQDVLSQLRKTSSSYYDIAYNNGLSAQENAKFLLQLTELAEWLNGYKFVPGKDLGTSSGTAADTVIAKSKFEALLSAIHSVIPSAVAAQKPKTNTFEDRKVDRLGHKVVGDPGYVGEDDISQTSINDPGTPGGYEYPDYASRG